MRTTFNAVVSVSHHNNRIFSTVFGTTASSPVVFFGQPRYGVESQIFNKCKNYTQFYGTVSGHGFLSVNDTPFYDGQ